ncbi:MAG: SDR family NAD(P)-dependent oxidoreductase, partial [bacterium]
CFEEILEKENGIDVVINCAGFGLAGSVEDTSTEEAKSQFETNFFGVMRVCRAALPGMRERGSGLIVNISSLGGLISAPFHGVYCASKFAVEGVTEALRMEVARFGIKVVLVEPGDFKTKFTGNRKKTEASQTNPAYQEQFENSLRAMEQAEQRGPEPAILARLIRKIIETPNPKLRYVAAPGMQPLAPLLKRILPWSVCEKIFMKHFGV